MATPSLPIEQAASDRKPNPLLPRAVKVDVVDRWSEVVTNLANHSGATVTYFLRFVVLLPMAVMLILAEILFRIDALIERQSANIAVFFLGGGR